MGFDLVHGVNGLENLPPRKWTDWLLPICVGLTITTVSLLLLNTGKRQSDIIVLGETVGALWLGCITTLWAWKEQAVNRAPAIAARTLLTKLSKSLSWILHTLWALHFGLALVATRLDNMSSWLFPVIAVVAFATLLVGYGIWRWLVWLFKIT